jgi:cell division transport system permease protein
MRLRLLFGESVRSLLSNVSTTVAATMTVLIAMFLLGLFVAIGSWAQDFGAKQKEKLLVKVYFCTETTCDQAATSAQINAVRRKLEGNPLVAEGGVTFVSKAEALERMRKRSPEIVENLTSNPLPPAFEVKAKDGGDVKAIGASLRPPMPGVEQVKDGEEISDRVINAARIMSTAFAIATLVLLVSSALLIANTIRLSIFSRRREIEVMKLVGATNWFVRGPFMLEGLICGILGSAAAVLLLIFSKELLLPSILGRLESASDVSAWPFHVIALIILGVGLTVGALGSGLTLRRFLQV